MDGFITQSHVHNSIFKITDTSHIDPGLLRQHSFI